MPKANIRNSPADCIRMIKLDCYVLGSVTVEVVKGHSMPKMDIIGLSDCYAYVKWLTANTDGTWVDGSQSCYYYRACAPGMGMGG